MTKAASAPKAPPPAKSPGARPEAAAPAPHFDFSQDSD